MTAGIDPKIVARLCVEQWKLIERFRKVIDAVPEAERGRLTSQARYSELQLRSLANDANLDLVTFDGESFEPGCPASADNLEDFPDDADLIVISTVEPAVISEMRVITPGRVLVDSTR